MRLGTVSDDRILEACSTSSSVREALRKLDVATGGGNYSGLKSRLLSITGMESFEFKSGAVAGKVLKAPKIQEIKKEKIVGQISLLEEPKDADPLLTVKQAAVLYGCTYANISSKIKKGSLPVEIVGSKKRVRASEVLESRVRRGRRGRPPESKNIKKKVKITKPEKPVKTVNPVKPRKKVKNIREQCREFVLERLSAASLQKYQDLLEEGHLLGFSKRRVDAVCESLGVVVERILSDSTEYLRLPTSISFLSNEQVSGYVEYVSTYRDHLQVEIDKHEAAFEFYKGHRDRTEDLLGFLLTAVD